MRAVHELPHRPQCTGEALTTESGPGPHTWAKWCDTCGALILVRVAQDAAYVAQWVPMEIGTWVREQLRRNQERLAVETEFNASNEAQLNAGN